MSARSSIRSALRARYLLDDAILRETCLFGPSSAESEGGQIETVGVYQLDITGPVGVNGAGLAALDAIAAGVRTGPTLALDAGRLTIAVSIQWRAFHTNPSPVFA